MDLGMQDAVQPAAAGQPALPPAQTPRELDTKKRKKDALGNRTHAEAGEEMMDSPAVHSTALVETPQQGAAELRQAAAALHHAVDHALAGSQVEQLVVALADCAEQVCHTLPAASSGQLPAALQLLQTQAAQAARPGAFAAPTLSAFELAALGLQAEAAAAAVESQQGAASEQRLQGDQQHGERQEAERFRAWYLSTFADCYAAEAEALQEAEPPIPAGVLLQCVRAAADSDALFPPHHRSLVLHGSS